MHRSILSLLLLCAPASAVNIIVDYTYDNGSYYPGTAARSAIEAAAATLSAHLADGQLAAVPSRSASGSASWNNGEFDLVSTVNFSASYVINQPSTGDIARLSQETWAADEIRIYVGMRQTLDGSFLGSASPATVGVSRFGFGYAPSWNDAVNVAAANATDLFQRGSNVRLTTVTDAMPYTDASGSYDVSGVYNIGIGPTAGSVSLNSFIKWDAYRGFWPDSDYDGVTRPDEYSLYSVALREMMVALGAEPASDVGMGQQMGLTEGDLQALRDVGWVTTNIPEPTSATLFIAPLTLVGLRRSRM